MAMVATTQVLHDGVRNVVMQLNGVANADAGPNSETNAVKVDVSELIPAGDRQLKMRKIGYNVAGGSVHLIWAGDDPTPFAVLSGQGELDYLFVGGARNPGSQEPLTSGDILLSTIGFESGSSYSIHLEMVKS